MITDISFENFEKYNDQDLQTFANILYAFLVANNLRKQGLIQSGPEIDEKKMKEALVYCDDRGITPEKNPIKVLKYIEAINDSL